MSLLSYNDLCRLLEDDVMMNGKIEHVNSASIDIQLGKIILVERNDSTLYNQGKLKRVILKEKQKLDMVEWNLETEGPYAMYPGEFILAHSVEIFNLPNNISAEYKLKSSMARVGLDHLNAGWCDAGWHGSVLTLELKNCSRNHEIILQSEDLIGQVIFFSHEEVPEGKDYSVRGSYNGDISVTGAKKKARGIIFGDRQEDAAQEEFNKNHIPEEGIVEAPRRTIDISEVRNIIDEGKYPDGF